MDKPQSETTKREGTCNLCGGIFSKRTMTRHLNVCRDKNSPKPLGRLKPFHEKLFHLVVEGADRPDYWMHLEAPASTTRGRLDALLRETWLECCHHLSAFTIGTEYYRFCPLAMPAELEEDAQLDEVLRPQMKFIHQYDFGTPTRLVLKVVSETDRLIKNASIQILARNIAPEILCGSCRQPATKVCPMCWDYTRWLCEECAPKHSCEGNWFLPVVNSPRTGMCAYNGR
jgi:hypothetical protein